MSLLILLVLSFHPTHAAISHFQRAGATDDITVKRYQPDGLVYLIGPLNESICIFQDSKVISQADKSKIECNKTADGNILITMKDVTKTIAGIYKWAVGSQTNMITRLMTLFVTDTPTTPYITHQKIAVLNEPFTLQCHTNSTTIPSGHNLTMVYNWTRNTKAFRSVNEPTLVIDKFRWKKRQSFRCTSTEDDITSPESQPVKIVAEWGPTDSFIFPTVGEEGGSINMSCSADCRPTCSATWKREQDIKSSINSLFIPSLNRSDQNIYTCILENKHGRKTLNVNISVEYGPSDITVQNKEDTSQHSTIDEGSPINIQCHADCKPTCNVSWSKDGTTDLSSGHLAINEAQKNQTGNYTCKASNKYSFREKTFELIVIYPAEVTTPNTSTRVDEGSNVRLSCEIDSMLPTNITWQRNEEVLQRSTLQTMNVTKHTYMDVVDLINIQCSNMGIYRCVAENKLGKNSEKIQVDVNCNPSPTSPYSVETYFVPSEISKTLAFAITANPKPKVINFTHTLENGTMSMKGTEVTKHMKHLKGSFYRLTVIYLDTQETDAGDYTVTVENELGQYQILYTLVVQVSPSKPTNLTLENVTVDTITVSFIKGFDGNAEQYFQIKVSEQVYVTSECENTTCTASVSDLEPGRRYNVQIRAANTAGKYSDFTDEIEVTTLNAPVKAEHRILRAIRLALIVVGVIVVCLLLAGIIYILTCRPCRRKRIKSTRKMNESSVESVTGEGQLDLWESVADDQSMALALPGPDTVVERRLGEYKYAKMRVESVMLTTFTEVEPEPRYINFRLDANVDSQPRYNRYLTEADHVDDAI